MNIQRAVGSKTKDAFAGLGQVLSDQAAVLQQLVSLAEKKRKAILDDRPEELEAIAAAELQQVRQLESVEARRMRLVQALSQQAAGVSLPASNLGLEALVEIAPPPEREELRARGKHLQELAERLTQLSDLNQRLLAHSLAVVNLSLDVLAGGSEGRATYERPGRPQSRQSGARLVDAKV